MYNRHEFVVANGTSAVLVHTVIPTYDTRVHARQSKLLADVPRLIRLSGPVSHIAAQNEVNQTLARAKSIAVVDALCHLEVPTIEGTPNLYQAVFDELDGGGDRPNSSMRNWCVNTFSWAVPSEEAIREIAKYSPIVEIGAGLGYWAMLLRAVGAEVAAYDNWERYSKDRLWSRVDSGGPRMVARHPDHALLMVWPELWQNQSGWYDTQWDEERLKKALAEGDMERAHELRGWIARTKERNRIWVTYGRHRGYRGNVEYRSIKKYTGNTIILVGESVYGCTGCAKAKKLMWDVRGFEKVKSIDIPQWDGLHDYVEIYQR